MVETKRIHEDTHRGGPHRRPPAVNPGFHRTDLSSYAVRYYFAYCKVICECVCQSDLHMQSIFTFRYTKLKVTHVIKHFIIWLVYACVCVFMCLQIFVYTVCMCVCVCVYRNLVWRKSQNPFQLPQSGGGGAVGLCVLALPLTRHLLCILSSLTWGRHRAFSRTRLLTRITAKCLICTFGATSSTSSMSTILI